MRIAILLLVGLTGCLTTDSVQCDFGTCPGGTQCDRVHERCVLPDQLTSCASLPDDTACAVLDKPGLCVDHVCLEKGCGDRRVNGSEQCDGTAFINDATDCTGVGFYQPGPIACNADCTVDTSQCHDRCGDGVLNGQELCDYATSSSVGSCTDAGYYSPGDVPCNVFCSYDYTAYCSGRCGDGMVNGPELCEPTSGAPSYLTCLDYGFDSGVLDCAATCNVDLASCHHFNLWPSGAGTGGLADVWQASANEAFVVGSDGSGPKFLHWDGQSVTDLPVPNGVALYAVSGTSATHVIAVGYGGRIVRYMNGTFTEMSSGVTTELDDVHLRTATDGWAVGFSSRVIHYNGTAWAAGFSASGKNLKGVWATSANDVWAVGERGIVEHYNGSWSISSGLDVLTTLILHGVWASGPSDVFAVGDGGVIAHFNGTAWSKTTLDPNVRFESVWGTASDNVLAAGWDLQSRGVLAYYDGVAWTLLERTSDRLYSVSGIDRTHALALDNGDRLLRWEGVGATPVIATPATNLADAFGFSRANLYLAAGTGVFQRSGATWSQVVAEPSTQAIWGTSATDLFAKGQDVVHFDGSTWSSMPVPPEFDVNAGCSGLWGSDPLDVYLVCDAGLVFYYDGSSWSLATTLSADLTDVWSTGANNVYVAGLGALYHFDGSTWTTVEADPQHLYNAIWGTSATNIYAVGYSGLIRHFDGTTWTTMPVPTTRTLNAIAGTGPSDIFVAGNNVLLHYNGSTWTPIARTVTNASGLWVDARAILVFGGDGSFVQIERACPTCL